MTITGFSPLNTQNCILNEQRIDLWQFSLTNELKGAEQILNDEELARGNRFHFSHHRRRFYNRQSQYADYSCSISQYGT